MQFSHSRLGCFENCPYKYRLQYIDKLKTIAPTDADNALILGTALHTGIEKNAETAIKEYCNAFPILDDLQINEIIKMEYLIPKVKEVLPEGKHELQIMTSDFIGFMDLLVPVDEWDGTERDEGGYHAGAVYDLYDFKYSNNVSRYMSSGQLHEYKFFFEKQNPGKYIRNMYFVFVPKVQIKQKKTEDLRQFRERIRAELKKSEVQVKQVQFDYSKVVDFVLGVKRVLETEDFEKNQGYLCNWCDYQLYCEKGLDYMLLPKNERRNVEKISKKVMWIYGAPFSGKTFLANKFPDPLMLNTDGNIRFVDAPYIAIKDIVKVEGRMTKKTLAWEVLKDAISELEKKQNDFKTIVVDLLEDTYEYCRLYMYDQMGISHESDDSFRAWDKVRTEFLSTIKRLMALDYENIILISHEDTSKDITKKGGDKITAIKPNLQEKTANKIAGMVDIVARVIADGEVRTLNFKTNEVIFGGGRLNVAANTIPLDFDELMKVYDEANADVKAAPKKSEPEKKRGEKKSEPKEAPKDEEVPKAEGPEVKTDEPAAESKQVNDVPPDEPTAPPSEEKPAEAKPRTRRRRSAAE